MGRKMSDQLKILCIHGLGDHRGKPWEEEWGDVVARSVAAAGSRHYEVDFFSYDEVFEVTDKTLTDWLHAGRKLLLSGVDSLFSGLRSRGDAPETDKAFFPAGLEWSAGYVVAWVENKTFQDQARKKLLAHIKAYKPDIILAHSLGSLVSYATLSHPEADEIQPIMDKLHYVIFGSQLANPFVKRNHINGRITPLPVRTWTHLFNDKDKVLTNKFELPEADNFQHVPTTFGPRGLFAAISEAFSFRDGFDFSEFINHEVEGYLTHPAAISDFWVPVLSEAGTAPVAPKALAAPAATPAATVKNMDKMGLAQLIALKRAPSVQVRKANRALLVGINDYAPEQGALEGCVNDVFRMSAVLQESGFEADDIRACLNHRATTAGIRERLEWLLDDPKPGDVRLFYYSGHGASIPQYGATGEPDHKTECLVPHDFDWSRSRAITDDEIHDLYAQLPYDMAFSMILDCCHSGGLTRNQGRLARGINPPDDIRHRELKWSAETQMWVPRDFQPLSEGLPDDGPFMRLGRAASLRTLTDSAYDELKATARHAAIAPYMPIVLHACAEHQLAYEYQHGSVSYGAFTFSLTKILREKAGTGITFTELVKETASLLDSLNYHQTPDLQGPSSVIKAPVPFGKG